MFHNKRFQTVVKTYALLCYSLGSNNNTKHSGFGAAEASVRLL